MARTVSPPRRFARALSLAATLGLVASCTAEIEPSEPAPDPQPEQQPLSGENLAGSNLGGSNLGGSNLGGSNLGGANLGGSNLGGSNLGGSNLSGTNLGGNNLGGSNLGGSNLGGSNLAGKNLGGSNLGGSNLAGSNLGGSNLGGSNTAGNNLSATNLGAGGNLAGSVSGFNIHGVAAANGMLYSGEDKWSSKPAQCVVMGIGSTAFAKLLGQQSANARISVALGMLPWGFASAKNGPVALRAWEAVVWGDKTYCVFVLAAPPATTWAGTAGFIKAVFRWNAPPTQSMDISGIEASASVDPTLNTAITTYTGMMNAAARFRAGTVSDTMFLAGELAFATATTNNQSVLVDFSSWVQDKNGNGLVLGNVESASKPPYAEALYVALDNGDGTVSIVIDDAASRTPVMPAGMFNSVVDLNMAYQAWQAGVAPKPVPRRCGGALFLNAWFGEPVPAGKCDDGLAWSRGFCEAGASTWSTVSGTTAPMNSYMQLTDSGGAYKRALMTGTSGCGALKPVLSETYVHMWSRSYDLPGACTAETDVSFCRRLNRSCGSVTATDNCGNVRTVANCGVCSVPLTCGGSGAPNVCGNPLSVTYEAESAANTISGAAFATVCEGYVKMMGTGAAATSGTCSGGAKVRYVGNSSSNYVKFNNVYAPVAGTYQLLTYGVVLGSRDFYVSANGGSGSKVTMTGPDWYNMVPAASTVTLNKGMNSLKVYNNSAYGPDLDRIVVTQPGGTCAAESNAGFCSRLARNCGAVTGADNCGITRTVSSCGTCGSGLSCGGSGLANVCGSAGGCSLVVTQNDYDGSALWGTATIRNAGPASSSNYKVSFDVPSGNHCTNDAVPFGAKLSPLTGSGSSAYTTSNHCVFTWTNASTLGVGESLTFHYSTSKSGFSSASNMVVNDPACE